MVKYQESHLDSVYGALADPTRRAILVQLAMGDQPVTELAKPFSSSLPAISKHLTVLEASGLIRRQSVGRQRICSLNGDVLREASRWIEHYTQFWEERLNSLEEMLKEDHDANK